MMKSVKVGIYARVSTDRKKKNRDFEKELKILKEQTVETQLTFLREYAEKREWEVFDVYTDEGISGSKEKRPGLDCMMADARKRKIDVVLVWKFDRFARSVSHLVNALGEFNALGVQFVSLQENIDTSTPMGKMVFTIIAAVAELERELIRERTIAGMERARREGKSLGTPPKKFSLKKILKLAAEGQSLRQIARAVNLSHTKVAQILKK